MEIQREAIIEIVGTQYEGRAVNHQPMFLQQELVLKHQSDNPHDHNAVLLLTKDGKELGFLPKGYASLYAPAIDSGRYNFSIEIVKAEPDPERPILIVKIISELASHSEKEIESEIIGFVQNIVNGYALRTKEYLIFIYSDTVNVDELLSALDKVRLLQKLLSCSHDFIESHGLKPNSDKYTPITKNSLTNHLGELKADIRDILKQIQKAYNESLDIDDEEEYHRVQSEIRERRKRFRQYDDLLASLIDDVASYKSITRQSSTSIAVISDSESKKQTPETENISTISELDASKSVPTATTKPASEISTPDLSQLTEQAFFEWLVSEGGVSESTAKQYISNIHSIEKLYQTIFGVRNNLLGADSADSAGSMIKTLIVRNEYIDANERRHNSFGAALSKFVQFADISVEGLKQAMDKKSNQSPVSSAPYVVKTVDFDNPHNCTYYKPCSFILNELKYTVGSWRELYKEFLILLYFDNTYSEIMKGLVGKPLYGQRIDFTDENHLRYLRKPIKVSPNFFAEGNLSAIDIIKHIKCLMELCSIANDKMVIEYRIDNETVMQTDTSTPESVTTTYISDLPEKETTADVTERYETDTSAVETPKPEEQLIQAPTVTTMINNGDTITSFSPDTTKPFVLKDAVIEILSSNAPEITKYRDHKNGINPKSLCELLKEYYGKTIGRFEISKLLIMDTAFRSVGKGCYILNEAMIPQKSEIEHIEPVKAETKKEETVEIPAEQVYAADTDDVSDADTSDDAPVHGLTIESILEVIKENSVNLQYEDGFGSYEVKILLSKKGIKDVSEEQIEALMSECSELKQIEDGYYSLIDNYSYDDIASESIVVEDTPDNTDINTSDDTEVQEVQHNDDNRRIILRLNGNIERAYDYSDALIKVCEFSINCKPFRMARITEQGIILNEKNVFYRKAVPVDGYNRLSNGLQLVTINTVSDLQTITNYIMKYCQIEDNMIAIISR